MEIGKFYQMTRITGKVIKFKLLNHRIENNQTRMEMFESSNSYLAISPVMPEELKSIKPIEPFEITNPNI